MPHFLNNDTKKLHAQEWEVEKKYFQETIEIFVQEEYLLVLKN
jgi:hypothetical protein